MDKIIQDGRTASRIVEDADVALKKVDLHQRIARKHWVNEWVKAFDKKETIKAKL